MLLISISLQFGTSPLHVASRGGHVETVKVLLAQNANPNTHDEVNNITMLGNSIISRNLWIQKWKMYMDIVSTTKLMMEWNLQAINYNHEEWSMLYDSFV